MPAKRALIVDDSRSARVILGRMLEAYGLQVDTAESGELALDYLRNAQPDVVFMDHLMPGIDGFDVIRAMKTEAQTASIPVMMYTSQEGEHYLQQARRVGALGVLSKTLKSADVARALYELHLLPDRREIPVATPQAVSPPSDRAQIAAAPARAIGNDSTRSMGGTTAQDGVTPVLRTVLDEQHAELQQELQANFSALSEHLDQKLRATVLHLTATTMAPPPTQAHSGGGRGWFAAALILVVLLPTAVIALLYWQTLRDNRAQLQESTARLAMVVTEQQTQIEQLRAELRKRQDSSAPAQAPSADLSVAVPYGEAPLAGARVQRLRALLERLQTENFQGQVTVMSFVGDFCLSGAAATGYSPARADSPARRCDLIGNPFEDMLSAAQRQSVEFATLLASTGAGKIRIEIHFGGRKPAVAYPSQSEQLTVGEWNAIAARNNRVEFTSTPDS